jgi:hypothetical protein
MNVSYTDITTLIPKLYHLESYYLVLSPSLYYMNIDIFFPSSIAIKLLK